MRMTLGATGLYERFAGHLFSQQDVTRGKPAPDLFLHAAATMGVEPGSCVVEDARHGLEGPGTTIFDDMAELPGLIGSGNLGYHYRVNS